MIFVKFLRFAKIDCDCADESRNYLDEMNMPRWKSVSYWLNEQLRAAPEKSSSSALKISGCSIIGAYYIYQL